MTQIIFNGRLWLALLLMLFLPLVSSQAQVTVAASDRTVLPDETFTIDITAENFNNILGCQFSVGWDSMAFDYVGIANLNDAFVDAPLNPFGTTFTSGGRLGFQWVDFSLAGISLGESAVMFSVQLKTLEEQTSEYIIDFFEFPTEKEVSNTDEEILEVDYLPGTITINGITDILEQNASRYIQVSSSPNPFRGNTNITIECVNATKAQLEVYSPNGQICYKESRDFMTGTYSLSLPENLFQQTGTYLLKIYGTDFISTYKLIAIQ